MEPTIIIDAGHGGFDNGASYNGRLEKEDNLRLALAVGKQLEEDGFPVVYTRTEDVYQQPVRKAEIANESGADYAVSFHRNAAATPNLYNGVQTLVYETDSEAGTLAKNVNDKMVGVGFRDLGVVERKNLAFLRRTKMPAILIEAGFIDSDKDNALFEQRFDELVKAIASGIEETVGTSGGDGTGQGRSVDPQYGVQVGLFRRFGNAQYLFQTLLNQGYDAEIIDKEPYFAVIAGKENTVDAAKTLERQLKKEGYDTLIITI